MTRPSQPTSAMHSNDSSLEEAGMNAIFSSGFDWRSIADAALSGSAPLWVVVAGILAAATGVCPHLYL
jgi:hypothetical protein